MSPVAETGLTGKTLRAARWTYLSTFLNASLQIGVTAVLARLLHPSAFGLVAMATLVLRFGQYFAQMGVGQSIVQRPRLDKEHIGAGFWVSVVVGLLFTGLAWLLAPVASDAFGSPGLTGVLRAMGFSFAIMGTSTTAFALLRRDMRFKAIALTDMVAYAVGYGGGVILAFADFGVGALVFAGLGQAAVASVVFNVLARPNISIVRRRQPYADLLRFGTAVSFVSFLEFLNSNLDTMVVGRLAGSTALGYYTRALSLTGLPMQYMSTSLSRVLLPSFSRIQHEPERAGRAYLVLITVFAGLGLPVALGMSGAAREIVRVLLGPEWQASVPVMRICAFASVAGMLSHFGGVLMEATARLKEKLALRMGQLAVFVLLIAMLRAYGLVGFALAFALSELSHLIAQSVVLSRVTSLPLRDIAVAYVPGLSGGGFAIAALAAESYLGGAAGWPMALTLPLQIVTGALILVLTALFVRKGQLYLVLRERLSPGAGPAAIRLLGLMDRVARFRGRAGVQA